MKLQKESAMTLHRNAMKLNEEFIVAEFQHKAKKTLFNTSKMLLNEALFFEKQAAMWYFERFDLEPTRAILFRSSGWMAYKLGLFQTAKELALIGLCSNAPEWAKEELMEILETIENPANYPYSI